MSENNLLSEQESANIAGVTIDTLRRYSELGLLSPQIENPQNENSKTFYKESDIRTLFYTKFKSDTSKSPEVETKKHEETAPLKEQIAVEFTAQASNADSYLFNVRGWEKEIESPNQNNIQQEKTETFVSSNNYQELVEINRGLREQIEMLREERTWLRERIERLESQSERNQMLLLAESENVRSLVKQQQRRGIFGLTLPWFGSNIDK